MWMIEIRQDDVVTGRVGPFDAECVADMYVDQVLIATDRSDKPYVPSPVYLIVEMDDPGKLKADLQSA